MKHFERVIPLALFLIYACASFGQCNNTLYGMSYDGIIYSIDPNTGALTATTGYASSVSNANAMAYAGGTTPKFYFFSNSNAGSLVFQSYTPSSGLYATLSLTNGPTGTVNSAAIATNYKGYYCLDTYGHLYYYNITSGNWKNITTVFKDQTGTDITSTVASYSSGDMAFDGNGNLWLLLGNSSTNRFGLYELTGPVPTNAVSSLTIKQVVPLGSSMPDGYDPVGIAFNAVGQMYISTLNTSTFARDLYLWSSPGTTPQYISSPSTVILDLSSCSMPIGVLPVQFEHVDASADAKGEVSVRWTVNQQANTHYYQVERSTDGVRWKDIGTVASNGVVNKESYAFVDAHPIPGNNWYRVTETDWSLQQFSSYMVQVNVQSSRSLHLWPNPARSSIYVESNDRDELSAGVFDAAGRQMLLIKIKPGVNTVEVGKLSGGVYILKPLGAISTSGLTFLKE